MQFYLNKMSCACALGNTAAQVHESALKGSTSGMVTLKGEVPSHEIKFGLVSAQLPEVEDPQFDFRTVRLLMYGVQSIRKDIDELISKYGKDRIAIVLGSSNTGIDEALRFVSEWIDKEEKPDAFSFEQIQLGSAAKYLKRVLGTLGPAYVVSTACSSSAKVFASARRLIELGVADAAIVGGVDGRCRFAMNGFNALEAMSYGDVKPFSANRDGINLGEGVALFTMETQPDFDGGYCVRLAGVGETSDAYHATAPEPDGKGAESSMRAALSEAGMTEDQIEYINMHGTGTIANDEMEGRAIWRMFSSKVLCASTKALTGHCLGAAGAIEAALGWLMLKYGGVIPHVGTDAVDPSIPQITLAKKEDAQRRVKSFLSNSFAFGGSNASVLLVSEEPL
jgi:3-oxoacyl-[acyl-carrier-protein] synthase-1